MKKKYSLLFILIFSVLIASCQIISPKDFVYLGHSKKLVEYQVYYDKSQKLFLLIDKHGCLDKSVDGSGTCIALDSNDVSEFKLNVLAKMIELKAKIKQPKSKQRVLDYFAKSGKKSIKRPVDITMKVTPLKQINVDNEKQYHLVANKQNAAINLVIMPIENEYGKKDINVFYTLRLPKTVKKQKTSTKPYIINPEYLLKVLQPEAVQYAESFRNKKVEETKKINDDFTHYLEDEMEI